MIQLENVNFSYSAEQPPALENATFSVPRGVFASIVGPNGGGKSTLVKVILGLLKPQDGTVRLFGESPERSRYRVGYVPQQARVDSRFPINALDVVLAGRFGTKAKKSRVFFRFDRGSKERAVAALETMGVADLCRRSFGDLSGGQRQRVLIARALCCDPELLILDEPTNNVDPSSAERFYELLQELHERVSILIASHDIGVVSQLVDSVVCVNRVVCVHPTDEFTGDLVRELYQSDVRFVRHDQRGGL
ncbi:MAG: metal ABC transporter ATP-binding protein [Thermoguttaceae bacterium]|jgi:zinc transport system ATP-binding protein